MMYVFASKPATAVQLNGTFAMLVLLLLYASPLSSLIHVVRSRNAASILLPWTLAALGCSSTWFFYGLATRQVPVMVPHCLGMALSILQLLLRAVFPTRSVVPCFVLFVRPCPAFPSLT
jgi:solute carrier family 50 (sugar transporter)